MPLIHPPVSCRQVLDGSAACGPREGSRGFGCGTGCAFSRTRPALAYPRGFIVRATGHRVASFGAFSVRSEKTLGRRQPNHTLYTPCESSHERSDQKPPGETPESRPDQSGDSQTRECALRMPAQTGERLSASRRPHAPALTRAMRRDCIRLRGSTRCGHRNGVPRARRVVR